MMATAGDVITMAKSMNAMDNEEVGSTDAAQTANYVIFINRALKELVHLAYRTRISDTLNITTDGDQTFKKDSANITDLYSPLRIILDSTGRPVNKRTAYDAPAGWWRESDNQSINTKSMTGNHKLHYVGYPLPVTDSNSTLDFPDAGLMALTFWVIGIAKESRNAYEESRAMYKRANERLKILVLANEAARGYSSSGYVPAVNDVDRIFNLGG